MINIINFNFLNESKTLEIVLCSLLMPFLNFPEKLILSFGPFISDIEIMSCNLLNVINDELVIIDTMNGIISSVIKANR